MRKPIPSSDRYEITSSGQVFRKDHLIKTYLHNNYDMVNLSLSKGETRRAYSIARLVYLTFIGPIPSNKVIHHLDQNRRNNDVSNLSLVSRGQLNKRRRLDKHERDAVRYAYSIGSNSQNIIAKAFKVSVSTINKIIKEGKSC